MLQTWSSLLLVVVNRKVGNGKDNGDYYYVGFRV